MKLLLRKDIAKLGIVGDVVEVADGYARNYLLPQRLAAEPTEANIRALAEERKKAEARRRSVREAQMFLAETLRTVEVANEEGVLYGSVGPREIAAALREEGHEVEAANVNLHAPIRHLDNVAVEVTLGEDITAEVKVWVVRSKGTAMDTEEGQEDAEKAYDQDAGMEAGADGNSSDA